MDVLLLTIAGDKEMRSYMHPNIPPGRLSIAGTTATMVLITKDQIYCANAGDSRTIISENGRAVDLSKDHKPNSPSEMKRILKAGG